MKRKKQHSFAVIILMILFIIVLSGCGGGGNKKKPKAPEPLKPQDYARLTPEQELNEINSKIVEAEATCQKQYGVNCNGCCKNPIFSNNILTCCSSQNDSCIERIQLPANFEGLGDVTIERFPNGNYGVWYGEKDKDFGNRQFVDAENVGKDAYKFSVDNKEYHFNVIQSGCGISFRGSPSIIESPTSDRVYYFVFVPLDNSWGNNQEFFEQKSKERAIFFQDISKFKFENVKFIYVPIGYANSNCDVTNFGNIDRKSHQKLKDCADKYTQSLGIGYERGVGFTNAFPVTISGAGYAYFGNPVGWASRGINDNKIQIDEPSMVAHEWGHTYLLCDEYKYSSYKKQNEEINCRNKWSSQCPKNDEKFCMGNTPTFRDYSGTKLPGQVCEGQHYSIMGSSFNSCGYDNTGGYEAVGPPPKVIEQQQTTTQDNGGGE